MSDLPDFKKILFPDMPPIPLEVVVPEAPKEVSNIDCSLKALIYMYIQAIDLLSKFRVCRQISEAPSSCHHSSTSSGCLASVVSVDRYLC